MGYRFDQQDTTEGDWRRFLGALKEDDLAKVVGGGLRRFALVCFEGSYDHKRHHAARKLGRSNLTRQYDDTSSVRITSATTPPL